jgi:glycosyltransferase involved in cell wall biosynthesis
MRIAFVSTILTYRWGGADTLWTSAAEAALARGDPVLLAISKLTADHARVDALAKQGASVFIRPGLEWPLPLWRKALRRAPWHKSHAARLNAAVKAFAPDMLIFSCGGTYDPILEPELIKWLRTSGTPYRIIANFQSEHPLLDEADRIRARNLIQAADRVYFVSPRNLEVTRQHLLSPLPNAEMVHNPLSSATDLRWPVPDPWSFACIARLEPVKGVDLLIKALAAGFRDIPGWQLNIYGIGQQREYLEECTRFFGITDRVFFRGFVPRLDEIWESNHLLVSPALDEGVPMTIPEAMLRARAVLATQVGGATEWIEPGRTGFICPAPSVGLLATSLLKAWELRTSWREMGAAAATRARALYRPNDFRRIVA